MNNEDEKIVQDILRAIEDSTSFIIFSHENPDSDAIGSQLALYLALDRTGKTVYAFSTTDTCPCNKFLPHSDAIKMELPTDGSFDTAIVLDCANPDRIGMEIDFSQYKTVINIDHHISNRNFGSLNWVSTKTSSTGELVYRLITAMGSPVDADIATCLYAAMFADTGGFRHSNTGVQTLCFASELVAAGADPHYIASNLFGRFPEKKIRLLGKSLQTLSTIEEGRVAYMWANTDHYAETGGDITDADEFVEYPRSIGGVDIAILFKEIAANEMTRVNFRSNHPECNVNSIASVFGGGGHSEASACNVSGTREEVQRSVLKVVREEIASSEKRK